MRLGCLLVCVAAVLLLGVAIVAVREAPPSVRTRAPKPITLAQFQGLADGITYAEACKVLGREGVLTSHVAGSEMVPETRLYSWANPDGTNLSATFQGDRLMSKSQFGLR